MLTSAETLIDINSITINKKYESSKFDAAQIERLANKFKNDPFKFMPILVCQKPQGYELITGHRRYIALKMAQFTTLPCYVLQNQFELVETLQALDWAHDVGEHDVLRNPAAYQYYKNLKLQYLKRDLPPALESQAAWQACIKQTLENCIKDFMVILWGNDKIEIVNHLTEDFKNQPSYTIELDKIIAIFAAENFELSYLQKNSFRLIDFLKTLLKNVGESNLNWANTLKNTLPIPDSQFEKINADLLYDNHPVSNKAIFENIVKNTCALNPNILLTQKNILRKINVPASLVDNGNYHLSHQLLSTLAVIAKRKGGQEMDAIFTDATFATAVKEEYTYRIKTKLNELYSKLKNDQHRMVIDQAYIEDCFDAMNIMNFIYENLDLTTADINNIDINKFAVKNYFIITLVNAISNKEKLKFYLSRHLYALNSDINISKILDTIILKNMVSMRDSLKIKYHFKDSDSFNTQTSAELLGLLLFLQRSYKHYAKQKIANKSIFLKKRLSFAVIQDYLGDDKHYLVEPKDGIHEFMFMIKLAEMGAVTTKLKITKKGKIDYPVEQFATYRETGKPQASSFYNMATAIVSPSDKNLQGALMDQTLSTWMGGVLKLEIPPVAHLDEDTQDNIKRLFSIYVFTMFYIEGLRNPGAFVVHAQVLNELINAPLEKLNEYIVNGTFIMTPEKSKKEGEGLHRLFQPHSRKSLTKAIQQFSYGNKNMAQRAAEVIAPRLQAKTPEEAKADVCAQFKLR